MLLAADIIRRDAHSSRLSLEALTLHDLLVAQERGTDVAT